MADVFISYARQDLQPASLLKSRLEALGLSVFLDVDGGVDAGERFTQRIDDAVKSSKVVLACWTPAALQREWVRRECLLAQALGKLLPVALEPLSATDLGVNFVDASYESLADFTESSEQHFGWSQTLASLERRLRLWVEAAPSDPEVAAVEGKANGIAAAAKAARPPNVAAPRQPTLTSAAALWDRLRDSNDVDALTNFADSFPGTTEAFEARNRITYVRRSLAAYQEANKSSRIADLDRFLTEWPDHPLKDDVIARRQRLEETEQRAAEKRRLEAEAEQAAAEKLRREEAQKLEEAYRRERRARTARREAAEAALAESVASERQERSDNNLKRLGIGGAVLAAALGLAGFVFVQRSGEARARSLVESVAIADVVARRPEDSQRNVTSNGVAVITAWYRGTTRSDTLQARLIDLDGQSLGACDPEPAKADHGVYACRITSIPDGAYRFDLRINGFSTGEYPFALSTASRLQTTILSDNVHVDPSTRRASLNVHFTNTRPDDLATATISTGGNVVHGCGPASIDRGPNYYCAFGPLDPGTYEFALLVNNRQIRTYPFELIGPSAVGTWTIGVIYEDGGTTGTNVVDLLNDGTMSARGQRFGTWTQTGDRVLMRWDSPPTTVEATLMGDTMSGPVQINGESGILTATR